MDPLILEHVTKIYGDGPQAVTALHDATLSIQSGELAAIVGPSGSGKTTLLAIAGALLSPTEGKVLVAGQDLSELSSAKLADLRLRHIGFVLQASNLVPFLTVRDQLRAVSHLAGIDGAPARQRMDSLLGELGLAERTSHYPEALSGGEKQRVAIARALMNDPALILADEPTANLDSARGRQVVELLRRLARDQGKAAVMVTHDERMLDLCDTVFRIADGVIQEHSPVASVA